MDNLRGCRLDPQALADWCRREMGSPPVARLFETVHLSVVVGLHLADGQDVVIKVRRLSPRIDACFDIQRQLFSAGFSCPEPLAGPSPLASGVATAEQYLPSTSKSSVGPTAGRCAVLLADLIANAPPAAHFLSIEPGPAWVDWNADRPKTWPSPDDLDIDLNDCPGPVWVDRAAERLRARLAADDAAPVIGHVDWEAHNIGWDGDEPVAVYDWDSLALRSEAAIAGAAAAVYPSATGGPIAATVDQTGEFLDAYQRRREIWPQAMNEVAWAAGLWVMVFNAKKEAFGGGTGYLRHLGAEIDERLRRAGA